MRRVLCRISERMREKNGMTLIAHVSWVRAKAHYYVTDKFARHTCIIAYTQTTRRILRES